MPPIYSYSCQNKKCKHEFDVLYTSISAAEKEEKEEVCPLCKSLKKKKLPPKGTSFELKGTGWARDQYK